jgi:hypothetical protein
MKPSIGRVVHYFLGVVHIVGGPAVAVWRPAIVVGADGDVCNLDVSIDPVEDANVCCAPGVFAIASAEKAVGRVFVRGASLAGDEAVPGTWRWPPREKAVA